MVKLQQIEDSWPVAVAALNAEHKKCPSGDLLCWLK